MADVAMSEMGVHQSRPRLSADAARITPSVVLRAARSFVEVSVD